MSIQISVHFLIRFLGLLSYISSLCIFDINSLSNSWFTSVFNKLQVTDAYVGYRPIYLNIKWLEENPQNNIDTNHMSCELKNLRYSFSFLIKKKCHHYKWFFWALIFLSKMKILKFIMQ